MVESFITMSCLFVIFAYVTTRRLGLLDPVPRDPKARVASYTSSVMSLLKDQLIGSEVRQWAPERVCFVKGAREGAIWVEQGQVHFQQGQSQSELPLGDKGHLTFDVRGSEISIAIVAAEEDSGAEHSVGITLQLAT